VVGKIGVGVFAFGGVWAGLAATLGSGWGQPGDHDAWLAIGIAIAAIGAILVVFGFVAEHFSRAPTSRLDAEPAERGQPSNSASLDLLVKRGQNSIDVDAVDFETTGQTIRSVDTSVRPESLRIVGETPDAPVVRESDLPWTLRKGGKAVVTIKRFLESGFSVEEHVPGYRVRAEVYPAKPTEPSRQPINMDKFNELREMTKPVPLPIQFALRNAVTEFVGDGWARPGISHEFLDRSLVWATLCNDGPAADFSVTFDLDITTARRQYPTSTLTERYTDDAAWENTKQPAIRVGHLGRARLMLAWTFMRPHPMFWFMLPQKELYGDGYGLGWVLSPCRDEVRFRLRAVNESTQQHLDYQAVLTFAHRRTQNLHLGVL
jgi:hypothetical protein